MSFLYITFASFSVYSFLLMYLFYFLRVYIIPYRKEFFQAIVYTSECITERRQIAVSMLCFGLCSMCQYALLLVSVNIAPRVAHA